MARFSQLAQDENTISMLQACPAWDHLDCRPSPQKGAVQAAIINHPSASCITLKDAMRFAGDQMLGIRLERHVIEQFKAPNGDAVIRQVHSKVLPAWPMDLEKGQELLQGYLPA